MKIITDINEIGNILNKLSYPKCSCGNIIYYKKQTKIVEITKNKQSSYRITGITSLSPSKIIDDVKYTPKLCYNCLVKKHPKYINKKIPINMLAPLVIQDLFI